MIPRVRFWPVLVLLVVGTGCGDNFGSIMMARMNCANEVVDAFGQVVDEESAQRVTDLYKKRYDKRLESIKKREDDYIKANDYDRIFSRMGDYAADVKQNANEAAKNWQDLKKVRVNPEIAARLEAEVSDLFPIILKEIEKIKTRKDLELKRIDGVYREALAQKQQELAAQGQAGPVDPKEHLPALSGLEALTKKLFDDDLVPQHVKNYSEFRAVNGTFVRGKRK